jgi:membrane associated rhomboid family serine protease/Flp pilus assembly protein TadD
MANCVQCGRQLPAFSFGKKLCRWCVEREAAQRGEESDIQRVEVLPWKRSQFSSMGVTQVFFGINVAVFVGMVLAGVSMFDNPSWQDLVRWGANYGPLTLSGQWWRLLTCVFVHGGPLHIASNMYGLWMLGRLAESLYGRWTFAAVYLLCGLSGSIASLVWNPIVLSVGASGAVFGIAGALFTSFYLGEFSLPRAAVMSTVRSLAVVLGVNLLFGTLASRVVDNAAHIGGLLMGLLLGALIAKTAPGHDDVVRRVGVLLVGMALVCGGVLWLDHAHAYALHAANGHRLLSENNTKQAIAELQTSIRERPNYAAAHFELARAYESNHDFANAEVEFKRVVELDPGDENALDSLGRIELELKRSGEARAAFGQMLKVNPKSAAAHFGLAAVFSSENKYSEALAEYQRTVQLDPEYEGVYYEMGLMQSKLGLNNDAVQSFLKQRDIGDDPGNEEELAKVYQAEGLVREAEAARERAGALRGQR